MSGVGGAESNYGEQVARPAQSGPADMQQSHSDPAISTPSPISPQWSSTACMRHADAASVLRSLNSLGSADSDSGISSKTNVDLTLEEESLDWQVRAMCP